MDGRDGMDIGHWHRHRHSNDVRRAARHALQKISLRPREKMMSKPETMARKKGAFGGGRDGGNRISDWEIWARIVDF